MSSYWESCDRMEKKAGKVQTDIHIKKMVTSAFLLATGLVLPMIIGQIPLFGNMLLPMHIPVMLCGYWCGWQWGGLVGFILPLLRSLIFGMPVMFPTASSMAVELAVYGICTGLFHKKMGRSLKGLYLSLIGAMIIGRIAWGIVSVFLYGLGKNPFTWKLFLMQGLVYALPGILLQLLLIPTLVKRVPLDVHLQMKRFCIQRFDPVAKAIRKLEKDASKKRIIIAIDGKCASGKTTLGHYLQKEFDANLFHMDDFFLQAHQRTEERSNEVGGNVDYERFKKEVLEPLLAGNDVEYRRFDCSSFKIAEAVRISPKRINVIEGSYSMHPYFGDIYDLKVFAEIDEESQLENILKRNGQEKLEVFKERWIPKEMAYFDAFEIKEKSDIVIEWN